MTFEDELKNIKGRIREAIYEGKAISIFVDYFLFCSHRTGMKCSSTDYFASYKSAYRFSVYCRPTILPFSTRDQIAKELERYIKGISKSTEVILYDA